MGEGWCPQAHRAAARPQRRPCLGPWELPLQPLGHLWGGDGGFSLEQPSPEDPWPRTTTFPLLGCRGCQGGASPRGRAGMGWAPLHTLTKFLLGYRAGVGSWCPEWSPRGPHGPRGKDQRNEPTLRARPGCSFPCCSHSLFSSLSTNHISLSLSLFCCMTCASSRDCTLLVSLTDCPQLAWDFFPDPLGRANSLGLSPRNMPSNPDPTPAPCAPPQPAPTAGLNSKYNGGAWRPGQKSPGTRFSLLQSLKKNDPFADAHLSQPISKPGNHLRETLPMLPFHHRKPSGGVGAKGPWAGGGGSPPSGEQMGMEAPSGHLIQGVEAGADGGGESWVS